MTQCHLPPSHACVLFFCYLLTVSKPTCWKIEHLFKCFTKAFSVATEGCAREDVAHDNRGWDVGGCWGSRG